MQNPVFVHFWLYFQSSNKKNHNIHEEWWGKKCHLLMVLFCVKFVHYQPFIFQWRQKKINDFLVNSSILFQIMLLWLEFNNNKNKIESTHAYLLTAWALRWSSHPGFWKNLFCHSTVFAINTVKFFIVIKHLT